MQRVAAFYRFAPVAEPLAQRDRLRPCLHALGLKGSVILASEGVNGTLAGEEGALAEGLAALAELVGPLRVNHSSAETATFKRLRVKVKREIVTMGVPETDPGRIVGTHVSPADWNGLITAGDVVVIDTRNVYEVALGTFAGAIDPGIMQFRAFPDWWRDHAATFAGKRVAMFCTGGIRCEKATSLALAEGAAEVFHLDGGILRYLQEIGPDQSLWRGECFVFDERIALGDGCAPGDARMCRACGRPLPLQGRAGVPGQGGVSAAPAAAAQSAPAATDPVGTSAACLQPGDHEGGGAGQPGRAAPGQDRGRSLDGALRAGADCSDAAARDMLVESPRGHAGTCICAGEA
jgi:UPF0176 protein